MDLQKLLICVCKRAGLNRIPKLAICKGTVAQARFKTIRVGRKLLTLLTTGEMEGVIAHEVHHVKKLIVHTLVSIIAEALSMSALLVAGLVSYLFLVNKYPTLISHFSPSTFQGIMGFSILLFWLALNRCISKIRELAADTFAASIVGRKTFTNALKKVYSIPSKPRLRARIWEWLNPHPPLNKRIEAIRNMQKRRYPSRQLVSIKVKAKSD